MTRKRADRPPNGRISGRPGLRDSRSRRRLSRLLVHLDQIIEAARASGDEWREFLRAGMFSAGIYRLAAGQPDRQTPHAEDEIYYVLAGRAELEIEGERSPVEPGTLAFVAKRDEHRFVDITEDLELLVLFAPPESG